MNAKKILVPVDFSSGSEAALDLATSLARDSGAALLITYVQVHPLPVGGGEFIYTVPDPPTEELRARLVKVLPKDAKIPSEHRLLAGDPADCIVKLAEDEKVDFIVMGTHGRRGLTRILMGSVAELVVRWAKCPVVTVKAPKKYYQVGQKQRPLRGSSIRLLSSRTIHVGQLFLIMNSAL